MVDEESAQVVKMLFQLCLDGNGPSQIARIMNDKDILNPSSYARSKGRSTTANPHSKTYWSTDTIKYILAQMTYVGHTVNFKTVNKSYKDKKKIYLPKESHMIFENTHEAIIEQLVFDRVQKIRDGKRKNSKSGKIGLFNGIVYCADCKKKLYFSSTEKYPKRDHYICSSYRAGYKIENQKCTTHYIRLAVLEEVILKELNHTCNLVKSFSKEYAEVLQELTQVKQSKDLKLHKKHILEMQHRVDKLDGIIKQLYEDKIEGALTQERFTKLTMDYEQEQLTLQGKIQEIGKQIETHENQTSNINNFLKTVKRYACIETLTPALLHELIDRIEVHAPEMSTGKRKQQIDIYYNFIGNTPNKANKSVINAHKKDTL